MNGKQAELLPEGVYPTLVTPFHDAAAGERPAVDFAALRRLVKWQLAQGCAGIFSPCQSSEMFELTPAERLRVATAVREAAREAGGAGAKVLGVGNFGATVEEQAASCRAMAAEADFVVVVVSLVCAEGDGDDVWRERVARLLELCPGVRFGLYECPAPYWRLLTPELLAWCASTGRFFFSKDTCCSVGGISAKLEALRAEDEKRKGRGEGPHPLRFYNANAATLVESLRLGGAGFSGICCNFYPGLVAQICENTRRRTSHDSDDPVQQAVDKAQEMMAVLENVVVDLYPRSAKEYLKAHQADLGVGAACRVTRAAPNEEQRLKLAALHAVAGRAAADLRRACDGAGTPAAKRPKL